VAAPTVPAKACSRCGATKPASDFNINKTTSSGLTSHCKVVFAFCLPLASWGLPLCQLLTVLALQSRKRALLVLQTCRIEVLGVCVPRPYATRKAGCVQHAVHIAGRTQPDSASVVTLQECIAAAAAERKKQKALVHEPTVAFKVRPVLMPCFFVLPPETSEMCSDLFNCLLI
jgi:hypothetical protein